MVSELRPRVITPLISTKLSLAVPTINYSKYIKCNTDYLDDRRAVICFNTSVWLLRHLCGKKFTVVRAFVARFAPCQRARGDATPGTTINLHCSEIAIVRFLFCFFGGAGAEEGGGGLTRLVVVHINYLQNTACLIVQKVSLIICRR